MKSMIIYTTASTLPGTGTGLGVDHGFLYGDGVFEGIRAYNDGYSAAGAP
jgi:branched-subunit amino acid aminotransferase/4-amino-4-deoxychorismate lyase